MECVKLRFAWLAKVAITSLDTQDVHLHIKERRVQKMDEMVKESSTQANASIEPNENGKAVETKFVVARLKCWNDGDKQMRVVGIYDTLENASDMIMDDMLKIMRDNNYECYVEFERKIGYGMVSWDDFNYWWNVSEVAA